MTQMNLWQTKNRFVVAKGRGMREEEMGSWELADANYYI